jgi:predicted P-loop ATPase
MASEVIPLNAWRGRLQIGAKGPRKTLYNLMTYLQNLPGLGGSIKFNQLTNQTEWKGRPIEDTDYVDIQIMVEQAGFTPSKNDIPATINRLAKDNAYHPIREYLDGLKWDGVNRLNRFLPILFGTPDTPYEQAIGSKWMIGAVARIYEPGCKMDNMLVLEGPQDLGKSSALRALFGAAYFTEMVNELRDHKRFVEQIMGKWVVEFAELSAIRRADVEMVKAVITMQVDRTQRNYARTATEHPRQCVLAASVNPKTDSGYLTDPTGNRRFWPVRCTAIDLPKIVRKRDQLWAEAVERYRLSEEWWLDNQTARLAETEQAARVSIDPWEDHLIEKLIETSRYTSIQIMDEIIKLPKERQEQFAKTRIAGIMERLGWRQVVAKERDEQGVRRSIRQWVRNDE